MSRHDDWIRLQHMLDHARETIQIAAGRTRSELDTDRMLNLALTRLLEIIGEAATQVSRAKQERHSEIPWPDIVGLRNRIIHGYDNVNFDILWQIITDDLPPLITALEAILGSPGEGLKE